MSKLSKEIKSLYIDIGALTFTYCIVVAKNGKDEKRFKEYQEALATLIERGINLWKKQKQKG